MSRTTCTALALGAALALSGTAIGQTLNAGTAQPQNLAGDLVAARTSTLRVVEATAFNDGDLVNVTVDLLDGDGVVIPATNLDVTSAADLANFTAGVDVINIDLSAVGVLGAIINGQPTTAGLRVTVSDESAGSDFLDFALSEAVPQLVQAILDDTLGSERIVLIFNGVLNNTSANNNANQTTAAGLGSLDDFEADTDAAFGSAFALDGTIVSNPTILATGNAIAYDLDVPAALNFGDFVRYTGSGDIKSITGIEANNNGVAFAAETPLTFTSATFLKTLGSGGTGTDVVRVTFNQALGDAGNASFYDSNTGTATWQVGGTDISVTVNGVGLDSENANSVLLDITLPGGTRIDADGLNADGDSFTLGLVADAGNGPETVLGTEYAVAALTTRTVGDGIAPARTGDIAFFDTTGDGVANAVGIVYNEPISEVTSNATTRGAVTFNTINSTVHPISVFETNLNLGITSPTDAANQVEIAGDSPFEFNASGFSRRSEDAGERLGVNNILVVEFDVDAIDFVGDGSGIGDPDMFPGGFDTGWADIAITAADLGVEDAAGNADETDLGTTTINDEAIEPVLVTVWFRDAENLSGGVQTFAQTTGTVGGSKSNDRGLLIFNEMLVNNGISANANSYSWGAGANDRFAPGNFSSLSNNIITFIDSNSRGFLPDLTLTIGSTNGVADVNGNDYGGGSAIVVDNTSPYVPRQFDINGNSVFAAFVNDAGTGFVEDFTLRFTKDIDFVDAAGDSVTPVAADFTVDGTPADSVSFVDNVLTIVPASSTLSASSSFTIAHNGGTAARRLVEMGFPANRVLAAGSLTATPLALPDIDGEFPSVMDIFGVITDGGDPVPQGTQVYGALAMQRVSTITITYNNVTSVLDMQDRSSLEAFTNFILGIKPHLYLFDDDNDVFFSNDRDDETGSMALMSVTARVARGVVTWQARGFTQTQGDSPQQTVSARGTATLVWDVLQSDDGTARSLIRDGYEIQGHPILSRSVVSGNDGSYLLHMTGPSGAFNGGQISLLGAPVILFVERVDGTRALVSSVHNAIDGFGTLQFFPLQTESDPVAARDNGNVDIDLDNVAFEIARPGWNLVAFGRDSGFAVNSSAVPQSVPQNITPFASSGAAAENNTILVGTTFDNAPAILQFGFFLDFDGNGEWTRNDDFNSTPGSGSLVIDPRGRRDAWFTMTDRGVFANQGVNALIGGYAFGYFNGRTTDVGIFQFGAPMGMSATFAAPGFRTSRSNLGWALITAPNNFADPDAFLASEGADFLIEFNRTDEDEVRITTFDGSGAGSGDTESISRGQAYFVHYLGG